MKERREERKKLKQIIKTEKDALKMMVVKSKIIAQKRLIKNLKRKRKSLSSWSAFWKWFASELFRKRIYIKVVGGQNLLASYGEENIVLEQSQIKAEAKQGIYIPNYNEAKKVYFLGFTNQRSHTRSVGKAAAGAIVGGVLTGGIGAVAGAAIGARKRNTSTALLDFEEVDTGVQFTVEIECDNNKRQMLNQLPVASR